jgi:hypothetical protein
MVFWMQGERHKAEGKAREIWNLSMASPERTGLAEAATCGTSLEWTLHTTLKACSCCTTHIGDWIDELIGHAIDTLRLTVPSLDSTITTLSL